METAESLKQTNRLTVCYLYICICMCVFLCIEKLYADHKEFCMNLEVILETFLI